MLNTLINSPFFGLTLTAAAWAVGCWVQKKTGLLLCNPLLIAVALIIVFLSVFRIPYAAYSTGGDMVKKMLPERIMSFERADRTVVGHLHTVEYRTSIEA